MAAKRPRKTNKSAQARSDKLVCEPVSVLVELCVSLSTLWSQYWNRVGGLPPPAERVPFLLVQVRRFAQEHREEHLRRVLGGVSQGKHLVEAALAWDTPWIGPSHRETHSETDMIRGEQWRLVMVYAGLERIIRSLVCLGDGHGIRRDLLDPFLSCCCPPEFGLPIEPPKMPPEKRDGSTFEQMKTALRGYLDGQWIRSWREAILLAQGLRNAITHGILSPSRARNFGLRPAMQRLTYELGRLAYRTLETLAAEESDRQATSGG